MKVYFIEAKINGIWERVSVLYSNLEIIKARFHNYFIYKYSAVRISDKNI